MAERDAITADKADLEVATCDCEMKAAEVEVAVNSRAEELEAPRPDRCSAESPRCGLDQASVLQVFRSCLSSRSDFEKFAAVHELGQSKKPVFW